MQGNSYSYEIILFSLAFFPIIRRNFYRYITFFLYLNDSIFLGGKNLCLPFKNLCFVCFNLTFSSVSQLMESYRHLGELHLTDELENNENFDIELHF